jgi:hypothetical protein
VVHRREDTTSMIGAPGRVGEIASQRSRGTVQNHWAAMSLRDIEEADLAAMLAMNNAHAASGARLTPEITSVDLTDDSDCSERAASSRRVERLTTSGASEHGPSTRGGAAHSGRSDRIDRAGRWG